MSNVCGETSVWAGVVFRCYRPRDEPHSLHMGFAVSSDDPNKSYTLSWEEGKRKHPHLDVHPTFGDTEDEEARLLEQERESRYGAASDDFPTGKW
jgi:hypothetical protein